MGRSCQNCGKTQRLAPCGACGRAFYCGVECQKTDWIIHKEHCKKIEKVPRDVPPVVRVEPKKQEKKKSRTPLHEAAKAMKKELKNYKAVEKEKNEQLKADIYLQILKMNYPLDVKEKLLKMMKKSKVLAKQIAAAEKNDLGLLPSLTQHFVDFAKLVGITEEYFTETESTKAKCHALWEDTFNKICAEELESVSMPPTFDDDFEQVSDDAPIIDRIRVFKRNQARAAASEIYPDVPKDWPSIYVVEEGEIVEKTAEEINPVQKRARQALIDSAFVEYKKAEPAMRDHILQQLKKFQLIQGKDDPGEKPYRAVRRSTKSRAEMKKDELKKQIKDLKEIKNPTLDDEVKLARLDTQLAQLEDEPPVVHSGIDEISEHFYGRAFQKMGSVTRGFMLSMVSVIAMTAAFVSFNYDSLQAPYNPYQPSERWLSLFSDNMTITAQNFSQKLNLTEFEQRSLLSAQIAQINATNAEFMSAVTENGFILGIVQRMRATSLKDRLMLAKSELGNPLTREILAKVFVDKEAEKLTIAIASGDENFINSSIVGLTNKYYLTETSNAVAILENAQVALRGIANETDSAVDERTRSVAEDLAIRVVGHLQWHEPDLLRKNDKFMDELLEELGQLDKRVKAAEVPQRSLLIAQYEDLQRALDLYQNKILPSRGLGVAFEEFADRFFARIGAFSDPSAQLITAYADIYHPGLLQTLDPKAPRFGVNVRDLLNDMVHSPFHWNLLWETCTPREWIAIDILKNISGNFSRGLEVANATELLNNAVNEFDRQLSIRREVDPIVAKSNREAKATTKHTLFLWVHYVILRFWDEILSNKIFSFTLLAVKAADLFLDQSEQPLLKTVISEKTWAKATLLAAVPIFVLRVLETGFILSAINSIAQYAFSGGSRFSDLDISSWIPPMLVSGVKLAEYSMMPIALLRQKCIRKQTAISLASSSQSFSILSGTKLISFMALLYGIGQSSIKSNLVWPDANRKSIESALLNLEFGGTTEGDLNILMKSLENNSAAQNLLPFIMDLSQTQQRISQSAQVINYMESMLKQLSSSQSQLKFYGERPNITLTREDLLAMNDTIAKNLEELKTGKKTPEENKPPPSFALPAGEKQLYLTWTQE